MSAERITRLDDYVSGSLADAEAEAFEVELFEAAGAGQAGEADFHDRLHALSAVLANRGAFGGGATREQISGLLSSGLNVQYYDFGAGGRVEVPAWPERTELIAFRLGLELRGYHSVEVEAERPDGTPIKVFRDVQYDPEDGAVYAVCVEPLARLAFRAGVVRSRVTAVRESERERETVAVFVTEPVAAR